MRSRLIAGLVAVVFSAGCASSGSNTDFGKKINQIRPGTPKSTVVKALGRPDEREPRVAGAQPTGPQPPITIAAGSRYEHWVYHRGDTDYHVFLAESTIHPGQWEVLSVSANPRSAAP